MRYTGRYCEVEDGFDLDEEINRVSELNKKFIKELKDKMSLSDYNKIALIVAQDFLESINL